VKLFTATLLKQLIANGEAQQRRQGTSSEIDHTPVCKLFNPVGASTWLLTEILPGTGNAIAFGLADLGMGSPEIGSIDLAELQAYKGPLNLGIERDLHWRARGTLSAYLDAARQAGHIVELPQRERGEGVQG
jgi:hypothetical protein